jgi:hypothetical protein
LHLALGYEIPLGGSIRLYDDGGFGLGDSIYGKGERNEEVQAVRLSDWLKKEAGLDQGRFIRLLRMNIEGAEYEVIGDLFDRGLTSRMAGFYGLWDDVGKIDAERGVASFL